MDWIIILNLLFFLSLGPGLTQTANCRSTFRPVIYGIKHRLTEGSPEDRSIKEFYVNIGSSNGVHAGSLLEASRRSSTYDLRVGDLSEELSFPIAHLRVLHVETKSAVVRLEKLLTTEQTPIATPRGIMVGDSIRIINEENNKK